MSTAKKVTKKAAGKKAEPSVAMSKSEQAYQMKTQGFSNSQIASAISVKPKTVPTLAKNFMISHKLPAWSGAPASIVSASEESYGAKPAIGRARGESKDAYIARLESALQK
jgi:hypothetical protein